MRMTKQAWRHGWLPLWAIVGLAGCDVITVPTGTDDTDTGDPGRPVPGACLTEGAGGGGAPGAELSFPAAGVSVEPGPVLVVWNASDPERDDLEVTVYVGDDPKVFENPLRTDVVCVARNGGVGNSAVEFSMTGRFFVGIEVTDGVNTIRRPADGVGVGFDVQEADAGRGGLANAVLLCPRQTQPARPVTRFQWSLGDVTPLRTQVFVGRSGGDSPFDLALRAFEVTPPTATSWTLAAADAFPIGETLTWGLRVETSDRVLFSFDGRLGESFVVSENVPPAGVLLAPDDDAVLADKTATFVLSWQADAGNCEDVLTSTVFFERLGEAEAPTALLDSPVALPLPQGTLEVNLASVAEELGLTGGRWAWGVAASDGTDETLLAASAEAFRTYRRLVRDTGPFYVSAPALTATTCGSDGVARDAIAFSYGDDNGLDTVLITINFAALESDVFEAPAASHSVQADETGTAVVFLQEVGVPGCATAAYGPGLYGIELTDGVNDPVRRVVSYVGPPTGACCAVDGGCTEGPAQDCPSGVYQGDGTTCSAVTCPAPRPPSITDCNGNGIHDATDIADGTSLDCNASGAPDECEALVLGDFDFDEDVDLVDFSFMFDCMTGPCPEPSCPRPLDAEPCCAISDFDGDGDVDLEDLGSVQRAFTDDA